MYRLGPRLTFLLAQLGADDPPSLLHGTGNTYCDIEVDTSTAHEGSTDSQDVKISTEPISRQCPPSPPTTAHAQGTPHGPQSGYQESERLGSAPIAVFPDAHGQVLHKPQFVTTAGNYNNMPRTANINLVLGTEPDQAKLVLWDILGSFFANGEGHKAGGQETSAIPQPLVTELDNVSPIPLEAGDLPCSLLQSGSPTYPEIYVRGLLCSGQGLPCWEPRPGPNNLQPRGVVPGDVGTYSLARGFRKIFNLWDDQDAIRNLAMLTCREIYCPLEGMIETHYGWLTKGETIVQGVTSNAPFPGPASDGYTIVHEFHCHCAPGAILVLTSSADLESTNNSQGLQSYIIQNAESIYRHAHSISPLQNEENLYIITGCIKSDTWAIAAYRECMNEPYNILQLAQGPVQAVDDGQLPFYQWTKKGSSHARLSAGMTGGSKNQTLFLQGFKFACSTQLRNRLQSTSAGFKQEEGDSGGGGLQDQWSPSSGPDPPTRGSGSGDGRGLSGEGSQGGSTRPNNPVDSVGGLGFEYQVDCSPFPDIPANPFHPSDTINRHLLDITGSDFALTHDDDWRFLFKSGALHPTSGPAPPYSHNSKYGYRHISVQC